ncbi:hypothetical protein C8R47DRAFT_1142433 [Mycena vitilis]|nr:hypothetical protein C8R47DRAFT_1142433 [Mycena vitilis]
MGYKKDAGLTSQGVEPPWITLLGQLESSGIDKQTIAQEIDFIEDFVREHPRQAAKESKPPPCQQQPASSSVVNVTAEQSGSGPAGITYTSSAAPVIVWPTDLELPPPRPQQTASSPSMKDTARGEEQSGTIPRGPPSKTRASASKPLLRAQAHQHRPQELPGEQYASLILFPED